MKYEIEITEILQKHVTVEAEDALEALRVAYQQYMNSEIVLDSNNHLDTLFNYYKDNN